MADTLTPNLKLTNQTEGGNNNTWGIKADDNFEQIDDKLGDTTSIITTGGTTVLTDEQEIAMAVAVSGTLVSNATVEFSGRGGKWVVANDTAGAFALTVKVTGQTGIEVVQNTATVIWCDGADIRQGVPTAELGADPSPQLSADLDTAGHAIRFDDETGIKDSSGNEQIRFQETASAVNQIDITNAATGNAPLIAATGDDTDIDLDLRPKGAGKLKSSTQRIVALAAGTAMLFVQTAAPTGWTKVTSHNDKALRVVSGAASSGGSSAFSTVFTSRTPSGTVGGTTLTVDQIPPHKHRVMEGGGGTTTGAIGGAGFSGQDFATNFISGDNLIENTGGGLSHDHPFSGVAMNFAVQYVDTIIATLD